MNIDFETCFTGAAKFAHEVKALVNQTTAETISIQNLLIASYNTAEAFNPLLHSCNIDVAVLDKIDAFTFNSTNVCFGDVQSIYTTGKELVTLIKEKSINELIPVLQNLQSLIKSLNQAKVSCAVVPKPTTVATLLADGLDMNLFKCIAEAKSDYDSAKTLIAILQDKNSTVPIEDVFEQSINLYNNIVVTVRDCFNNSMLPTVDNVSELKVCVKDIHEITTDVIKAYNDIKSLELKDLFETLKAVYSNVKNIQTTCVIKKPSFLGY